MGRNSEMHPQKAENSKHTECTVSKIYTVSKYASKTHLFLKYIQIPSATIPVSFNSGPFKKPINE